MQPQKGQRLRLLKTAWHGWIKLSEMLRKIQKMAILWTILPFIAVPFKLFADSQMMKRPRRTGHVERYPVFQTLNGMKKKTLAWPEMHLS